MAKKPVVERLIQTIKHEWLYRHAPKTLAEARDALASFPTYYHQRRPHQGRACHHRTPEAAFPQASLPVLPRLPEQVDPDAWLSRIQGKRYFRKVTHDGTIQDDPGGSPQLHNWHGLSRPQGAGRASQAGFGRHP